MDVICWVLHIEFGLLIVSLSLSLSLHYILYVKYGISDKNYITPYMLYLFRNTGK